MKRFTAERAVSPDTFEFQMLYGIRRDYPAQASRCRLRVLRLRAFRPGMVSLLHAPARRAARERGIRRPQPVAEK